MSTTLTQPQNTTRPAGLQWQFGLAVFGNVPLATVGLVALWGFAFSILPVGWSTWITRTVPDEAESGGGLFIATTQLAMTLGAAAGGVAIDRSDAVGAAVVSGIMLLVSVPVCAIGLRTRTAAPAKQSSAGLSA